MESVSLAYGYGWRNSGDLAINQGSLAFLATLDTSISPTLISIHPEDSPEFHETAERLDRDDLRYDMIGGPMRFDPKRQSTLEQLVSLSTDGIQYSLDRLNAGELYGGLETEMTRKIRNSDFFFYNGGNLIHHKRSLPYLLGILYPLQIANQHDIPYGLLPHTIFDLDGRYRPLINSLLDESEFVWTRDNRSYEYLTSQFSFSCPIRNGIDTAFFSHGISASELDHASKQPDLTEIAVVPRFSTLGDTGKLTEDAVESTFKEFITSVAERGVTVQITVQTEVEREWINENESLLRNENVELFESFSPDELRDHYDRMDLLVTMRLHAGIFALSVGTPAIGLYREQWGPKTPGTWETLGIEEYALSTSQMTVNNLFRLCEDIVADRHSISELIVENINRKKKYMIEETRLLMDSV